MESPVNYYFTCSILTLGNKDHYIVFLYLCIYLENSINCFIVLTILEIIVSFVMFRSGKVWKHDTCVLQGGSRGVYSV